MKKTIRFFGLIVFFLCFSSVALTQDEAVFDEEPMEEPTSFDFEDEVAEKSKTEESLDNKEGAISQEHTPFAEDENAEVLMQIEVLNNIARDSLDFTPYMYTERGRRSPFKAPKGFITIKKENFESVLLGDMEQKSGLEGYEMDSFFLTAIIWDVKRPKALLRDPSGVTYYVEEGTRIGRYGGYVAEIREGEVILIEPNAKEGEKEEVYYRTLVLKLGR